MKPDAAVAVAISGGIDSLVTAFLLKKQYKNIIGLHFVNGYESGRFDVPELPGPFNAHSHSPVVLSKLPTGHPMHQIQKQIDIPIHLVDCRRYFQKTVVDYFVDSYRNGLTPNPCMICNPLIKFGILLDLAKKLGASNFATGHYARIDKENNLYFLQKGVDPLKDQSYFLALIPQKVLPFIRFPLGELTKQQVIEMAKHEKLTPVLKKESQDVCFIQNNSYAKFLSAQNRHIGSPGIITDINGNELGSHKGLHHFTIGQRRGINCPASQPYYVIKIDIKQNRLIVGAKTDLYRSEFKMHHINWFVPKPKTDLAVWVKIRYRHEAVEAILIPPLPDSDAVIIRFKTPQPAVTPGQGAVCYVNYKIIAGGWIDE